MISANSGNPVALNREFLRYRQIQEVIEASRQRMLTAQEEAAKIRKEIIALLSDSLPMDGDVYFILHQQIVKIQVEDGIVLSIEFEDATDLRPFTPSVIDSLQSCTQDV